MTAHDRLFAAGPAAIPVPRVVVVRPAAGASDRLLDWLDAWPAGSMAQIHVVSARHAPTGGGVDVVVGVSGRRTRRVARAARVRAIVLPSESRLGCIGAGRDRSPASGEDPLVVGDPEALYFMLDRLFIEPDIYRVDAVSRDRRTPFRPR